MSDIVKRLRLEADDAADWDGRTMKQWDKIRALCAERDGSDLPRLMFESLVDGFVDLMVEGAEEIERLRDIARRVTELPHFNTVKIQALVWDARSALVNSYGDRK